MKIITTGFFLTIFLSLIPKPIAAGSESANTLIDTAFPKEIYKKHEKILKGIYIFDKNLPSMDDKELSDILKIANKIFYEQLGEEIVFSVFRRIEIEDILGKDAISEKVGAYCEDYIIDFSSKCDLNSFSELFETRPNEQNRQAIFENLLSLFNNQKVREKFPVSALKSYFPIKSENINDILTMSVKIYVDLWAKMSAMKTEKGIRIFSENNDYYSLPKWRAYFNRYDAKDIDFIITNAPLVELSDTPTLHLMKRGGLTGGTILSTVSPFSKKRVENKNILLVSHFIYYFEDDFFKSRDLKTKEDKQKALAYTLLMEYLHDRFSAEDNYKADNILKPANGFKFKEWYKNAEKKIFKEKSSLIK